MAASALIQPRAGDPQPAVLPDAVRVALKPLGERGAPRPGPSSGVSKVGDRTGQVGRGRPMHRRGQFTLGAGGRVPGGERQFAAEAKTGIEPLLQPQRTPGIGSFVQPDDVVARVHPGTGHDYGRAQNGSNP